MLDTDSAVAVKSSTFLEVTHEDLPLCCPTPEMTLWNMHPRVFLPIEKTGKATCPYCGSHFLLKQQESMK